MVRIFDISESLEWDKVVRSFSEYDVYYMSGYVKAFQIHGDGIPQLLYYEANGLRAIYVFMKRTTDLPGIYDSITPYGYGGVLFEGDTNKDNLEKFWAEYVYNMKEQKIIDNFVRYHPVLSNAVYMRDFSEVIDLGKTISIDLTSPEIIWENISSKNRNMIRKAEKNGIKILHSKNYELFKDFMKIYNSTMDKDNASSYYYFKEDFYKSIYEDLNDGYEMFYAVFDDQIIAMSIILYANKQMHYHLSGSLMEYRNLAPSNLLLYKAALWGCENGFKTFHLGGGVGSGEDNLYKFKAAFNKNSDCRFSIGKEIFDKNVYDSLVYIRNLNDSNFNVNSSFFPLYRS